MALLPPQKPITLEEIGLYAHSPLLWATYQPDETFPPWRLLQLFCCDLIAEELKLGPLSRDHKYKVLDRILLEHFQDGTIDKVLLRKTIEQQEALFDYFPKGKRISKVPGVVEVGRALIEFTSDIVIISANAQVRVYEFLPPQPEELPWWSEKLQNIKYLLTKSFCPDNFQYYITGPSHTLSPRHQLFKPSKVLQKELYISLQFWHAGIVNRILP